MPYMHRHAEAEKLQILPVAAAWGSCDALNNVHLIDHKTEERRYSSNQPYLGGWPTGIAGVAGAEVPITAIGCCCCLSLMLSAAAAAACRCLEYRQQAKKSQATASRRAKAAPATAATDRDGASESPPPSPADSTTTLTVTTSTGPAGIHGAALMWWYEYETLNSKP